MWSMKKKTWHHSQTGDLLTVRQDQQPLFTWTVRVASYLSGILFENTRDCIEESEVEWSPVHLQIHYQKIKSEK